ncbi:hypothetical protein [endosymbiont GvMRE of Glomus versiforme]|uniref:hypothetical protein n=1 Tax=endosymbiont GvMRE of Glomus versiforme TaxID=2039283 RepID=UPI0011C44A47|nr:hypothetical protein [endosymbiont GvMRE of Glomus versiforme]
MKQNQNLQIDLDKQIQNYQQLAETRNKAVFKQIQNINEKKLTEILPEIQKEEIQQVIQANNYNELANQRNKVIAKYINQNASELTNTQKENIKITEKQKQERIVLISLLVVSLVSIGWLLGKIKKNKKT